MHDPSRQTSSGCSAGSVVQALDVLQDRPSTIRVSRTSRWRMASLIVVHLLILAHIAHWLITGRTVSPVEPSEAMYTLNDGHLNAGFVFFALALLATMVAGRFVCGWGCHLIAYQDLCAWLLRKTGIKPKPFRSRLLVFAPLALAVYMFVWPSAYRWWMDVPRPPLSNHLMTTDFWQTFPGLTISILTVLVCGFMIVYFLGSKGFCTYACPYGGFFRVADQIAPGRIVVSDACEQCGHCTATCTSNVRVHEEVARYGMVVDPGCMKCLDCVSVCPKNALSVGLAGPSLLRKKNVKAPSKRYDFAFGDELLMAAVGLASLLAFRGLYNQIPLLLAMAMAGITGYLFVLSTHLIRKSNVRVQNFQLRRGGRLTRHGVVAGSLILLALGMTTHSAVIQYHVWRGDRLLSALALPDDVWVSNLWWEEANQSEKASVIRATDHLEKADRQGFMPTESALRNLVWLYLAAGRNDQAELTLQRLRDSDARNPEIHRSLAEVLRKLDRTTDAESAYRRALELDATYTLARSGLCTLLLQQGRTEDAMGQYREAISHSPDETRWRIELSRVLLQTGRMAEAQDLLGELVKLEPPIAEAHYNFGMILLQLGSTEQAIIHLTQATQAKPDFADAFYNLSVAAFIAGRPDEAIIPLDEAIRLRPGDPQSQAFRKVVTDALKKNQDSNRQGIQED